MHRSGASVMPADRAMPLASCAKSSGSGGAGEMVVVGAVRLVAVGLPVPVASEAQHADVHRAAAADHRHVGRHRAVDERAAPFDERELSRHVQTAREVKGARSDLHGRTLPLAAVRREKKEPQRPPRPQSDFSLRAPRSPRFLLLVIAAACLLARPAAAHPVPFTYLDLRITDNAIEGTLVAHIFDLGHDLNIDPAERLLDPAIAAAAGGGDREAVRRPADGGGRRRHADAAVVGGAGRRRSFVGEAGGPLSR